MSAFLRAFLIASTPFVLGGWIAGALDSTAHGYAARAMPNMARFAVVRALGPAIVMGLTAGFWSGLMALISRRLSGSRRRVRRSIALATGLLALVALAAVAQRLPTWRFMAKTAAYTGQSVNIWLGVIVLGWASVQQATLPARVQWISILGAMFVALIFPAALIERRWFRSDTPDKPAPARRGPAAAAAIFQVTAVVYAAVIAPRPGNAELPPIIWISIDTLRADHTSVYGYDRDTTPNLATLAEDGTVVEQFISTAPWTLPTHASMFSGQYPGEHGVTEQDRRFSPRTPLVGELLKERGYRTGAVTTALLLAPTFGFDSGFDKYEMNIAYDAQTAANRARRWLLSGPDPNFLFLHVFDVHYPYDAPPPFIGRFAEIDPFMQIKQRGNFFDFMSWVTKNEDERLPAVLARYDEQIVYVDQVLGWFFTELKKHDLYDRAWIFVVADHGEEFFDHGSMGHSSTMYEELVHVPLIVKAPGSACGGTRLRDGQISQTAIAAMLTEAPDQASPESVRCDAETGVPELVARHRTFDPVISESRTFGPIRVAARKPGAKLLSPVDIQKSELAIKHEFEYYDLVADPHERNNIYKPGADESLEHAVAEVLRASTEQPENGRKRRVDPQTAETLKSLGYLQ